MTSNYKVFIPTKENKIIIDEYIQFKIAQKNIMRPRGIKTTLEKLSYYHKNKNLKNLTAEDIQKFIADPNQVKFESRNTYIAHIIPFYRWVDNLPKKQCPKRVEWLEYNTNKQKEKRYNPKEIEEHFIQPEEYEKIINYCQDFYGQRKALFETYFLTGARPEELALRTEDNEDYFPQIRDVEILKDGNIDFTIYKSKTKPRTIHMPEYPENLIRYMGNHPEKDNPKAPLFFSLKSSNKLKPMQYNGIKEFFNRMKKNIPLRKTLVLKSFRKTRATILINNLNKLPEALTPKEICNYMGWKLNQYYNRTQDYDTSTDEQLRKKLHSKPIIDKSYDTLLKQKDQLEHDFEQRLKLMEQKFEENFQRLKRGIKNEIQKMIEE